MHVYESAASGIGYPYVWDKVCGWRGTPLTYNQMHSQTRHSVSALPIERDCGPGVMPAEDAPEDEDDGLPTAGTAAMDLDRAHLAQTNAPAASSSREEAEEALHTSYCMVLYQQAYDSVQEKQRKALSRWAKT